MKPRHICVWSGKRGGFGAMAPTLNELAKHPAVKMSVVVTDQHLYDRFGKTIQEVQSSFPIAAAINMEQQGDSNRDRARAVGVCLAKSADVLGDLAPDILLVIGDRGEVFAACVAAHNLRIAIAHVQGGDVSGSLDEPVRHAITKLAHIHFPSTEASARRIIAMGEEKWRVHTVGDTHIDQIFLKRKTPPDELRGKYGLPENQPFLLVLQHSDSTVPGDSRRQMAETVAAALSFGLRTLLIYPCSDQGFEGIIQEIEARKQPPLVTAHPNLPAADFIGLEGMAACLVGNSSAGLIEAPYFGLPSVNVGDRQIGRERCANVLDAPYDRAQITAAIERALQDQAFRARCRAIQPPFGDGTAYKKISDVLTKIEVNEALLNKRMTY